MNFKKKMAGCIAVLMNVMVLAGSCQAESNSHVVKLATWNIEMMTKLFDQYQMPDRMQNQTELWRDEEDLYEIKRTIGLPRMRPDILVIEECCRQDLLEYFNQEWLDGAYEFVKVFPGNTPGQTVAMMARKGFKPLKINDQYYLEKDVEDPQGRRLFSRGPAFVLFQAPGGERFWVGGTHAKSKYNNSQNVTRWRIREMTRTRAICGEIIAAGESDFLILMGDFNDDFGMDNYEKRLNTDAVEVMVKGQKNEKLFSPTRQLLKQNPELCTYHCELKPPRYRSFLDQAFVSPALSPCVSQVDVVDDPIAAVASDHYPVAVQIDFSKAAASK